MIFSQESCEYDFTVKMLLQVEFQPIMGYKAIAECATKMWKKIAIMSENIWAIHHHMMHICFFLFPRFP